MGREGISKYHLWQFPLKGYLKYAASRAAIDHMLVDNARKAISFDRVETLHTITIPPDQQQWCNSILQRCTDIDEHISHVSGLVCCIDPFLHHSWPIDPSLRHSWPIPVVLIALTSEQVQWFDGLVWKGQPLQKVWFSSVRVEHSYSQAPAPSRALSGPN